jgi:hypothetical protein
MSSTFGKIDATQIIELVVQSPSYFFLFDEEDLRRWAKV